MSSTISRGGRLALTGLTVASLVAFLLLIQRSRVDGQSSGGLTGANLVGDADGDGLPDVDELGIFRTNPSKPDTDGDGQWDVAELRAGTDPLSAASVFRIQGTPTRRAGGEWEISWTSVAGRTYRLQRLDQTSIALIPKPWTDVATVTAAGASTAALDLPPAEPSTRLYRVMLMDEGQPRLLTPAPITNGGWRIAWIGTPGERFTVQRTDANRLSPSPVWTDIAVVVAAGWVSSLDDHSPTEGIESRYYRLAIRKDPPVQYDVSDAARFVPLSGGGAVTTNADGTLPPFEFRPSGASSVGAGQGLAVKFPQGARLVDVGGRLFLEFTNASVRFGPNSPLQLVETATGATVVAGGKAADPGRVGIASLERIPVGPLSVDDLRKLLGLPSEASVPVSLFGKVRLELYAGLLEDGGLTGGRVGIKIFGLPLPGQSGDHFEYHYDFEAKDGVRIPYSGEFELPDGSDHPPKVRVPAERPLWITIKPNGELRAAGRAELEFPGGKPKFDVDFGLDDPNYHLQITAQGVHLPLIGSLSELLPRDPSNCVPTQVDSGLLDKAGSGLRAFDQAYYRFAASVVGTRPGATGVPSPPLPPDAGELGASLLEAWTYSAYSRLPSQGAMAIDSLEKLFRQERKAVVASRDLESILLHRLALARTLKAERDGQMAGQPPARQELDVSLNAIVDAAVRCSQEPDAVVSLQSMRRAVGILVETEVLLQQLGRPTPVALQGAFRSLLKRFADRFTASLTIQPGVFLPNLNAAVTNMNRFVVFDTLSTVVGLLADAQLLGLDLEITAPIEETLAQLALHLNTMLQRTLIQAEQSADYPGFLYALEDVMDLVALGQTGILPDHPVLAGFPAAGDLAGYGARLAQVLEADMLKPAGQTSLRNRTTDLRRLLRVLKDVPATVTFPAPPFQRAFDRMETLVASEMNLLTAHTSLARLLLLLEGGMLQERLRAQFNLIGTPAWEPGRLRLVAGRIAELGLVQLDWTSLHHAAGLLIAEADRQKMINREAVRRQYLLEAAGILEAAHTVAVALWNDENLRRNADPSLRLADMLLPGDIFVDEAAGGIRYNFRSRQLDGSFSGRLRLPKFQFELTVDNAAISSGGAFDLSAHGSLGLPIDPPFAWLSIPARRPLHLSYDGAGKLSLDAAAALELTNGMKLRAHLSLNDPVYSFGVAADGVRFDVAARANVMVPTLPNTTTFTREAAFAFNGFLNRMGATLELLSPLADPVVVGDPGDPPDFQPPVLALPTDSLEALAASIEAHALAQLSQDLASLSPTIKAELRQLKEMLRAQRSQVQLSELLLRRRVLQKLLQSLADRQAAGSSAAADLLASTELRQAVTEYDLSARAMLADPAARDPGLQLSVLEGCLGVYAGLQGIPDYNGIPLHQAIHGYVDALRGTNFTRIGLLPATGLPAPGDSTFAGFTAEALGVEQARLLQIESIAQGLGLPEPAPVRTALQTLVMRRRELLLDQVRPLDLTDINQYPEIGRLTHELTRIYCESQSGLFDYPAVPIPQLASSNAVVTALQDFNLNLFRKQELAWQYLASKLNPVDPAFRPAYAEFVRRHGTDFFGDLARGRESSGLCGYPLPPAAITDTRKQEVARRLGEIDQLIARPWPADRLRDAAKLLQELVRLAEWAEELQMPELTRIRDIHIPQLTLKFTAAAQAQKAWWVIDAYAGLLLEAAENRFNNTETALKGALEKAAADCIKTGDSIVRALISLLPGQRPLDFQLAAKVSIDRAFGEITYDRETQFLRGSFGGRLGFPEIPNQYFDLTQATLATDGSFSIQANASGSPINGATLSGTLNASGGVNAPIFVSGRGALSLSNGPTVAVSAGFDPGPGVLSFSTDAQDLEQMRLTDEVVFFEAGFALTLQPNTSSGSVSAHGSVGLFARQPLPATPTRGDFHLVADHVNTRLVYQPGHVNVTLSNGTLRLPALFTAGLCPAAPSGSGPAISLNPATPVVIDFVEGGSGVPPSVGVSGEIDFQNLGLQVSSTHGVGVELCEARLRLVPGSPTTLTNVSGILKLGNRGQFNLVDGYVDVLGHFALLADGELELGQGVQFTLDELQASYDGSRFEARTLAQLDFGGGVVLKPTPPPGGTPGDPPLPTASLFIDTQNNFRVQAGGRLELPAGRFVAVSGEVQNDSLVLRSSGSLDLGNGIALEPLPGEPVAALAANTRGVFEATVAGQLQLPGNQFVTVRGQVNNTTFRLTSTGTVTLGGVTLEPIGGNPIVAVEANVQGQFEATVSARALLGNGQYAIVQGRVNNTSFELISTGEVDLASGIHLEPMVNPADQQPLPIVRVFVTAGGAFQVEVAGRLLLPSGGRAELLGLVDNNSLFLESTVAVHLGNGVWLRPASNGLGQRIPTLHLSASTAGSAEFSVRGLFDIPGPQGVTQSVDVGGSLRMLFANGQGGIESFSATGQATTDWTLPGDLVLKQGGALLSYQAGAISAQVSGQLEVGDALVAAAARLTFPDVADPRNVNFDGTLAVANLKIQDEAVLNGSARLEAGTQPSPYGRLHLFGSAGLLGKSSPLPQAPGRSDFHLFAEDVGARFDFTVNGFTATLTNGTLHLPEIFGPMPEGLCPGPTGSPAVALGSGTELVLAFQRGANPPVNLSANGSLLFERFGMNVPGIDGMAAAVCSARLQFGMGRLPVLTNVTGSLQFVLRDQTNNVDLVDAAFSLEGFPSGTIALRNDLELLDLEGFKFTILGVNTTNCTVGSALEVFPAGGFTSVPSFRLTGGIRVTVPLDALASTNIPPNHVTGVACGELTYASGGPAQLTLQDFAIGGTFRMGPNGPLVQNAELRLQNLQNLFNLGGGRETLLAISGTLQIPQGPALTLNNARFTFFEMNRLPRFSVDGLGVNNEQFALMNQLPANIRSASFRFLNPTNEVPELFRPDNIELMISATVSIPPGNEPYFGGNVDNLKVRFTAQGVPVVESIGGFGMTLNPGFEIPPIEEIGGRLYVGGLDGEGPDDIYFVGRLGGSYQGYKVIFQGAFNLTGPIGMCLDVNFGAVGIPLGPTGFLFTGASGGISYVNNNGDPCDFTTYYKVDADGNPIPPSGARPIATMTWADLRAFKDRAVAMKDIFPNPTQILGQPVPGKSPAAPKGGKTGPGAQGGEEIPCPGDCPPATVNIFCEPHPDQEKHRGAVILKFTSIDESTLNSVLGITPQNIAALGSSTAQVATEVARRLTNLLADLQPPIDPALLGGKGADIQRIVGEALQSAHGVAVSKLTEFLNSPELQGTLYEKVRDFAYAGLPCPDVTMKVAGTLTHAAVSSFLSVTGEGTISTAGSAGVTGKLNLLGMPLGKLKGFVAATDSNGLPSPSICGQLTVAVGPLELGEMKLTMDCPGCVTGVIQVVGELGVALGSDLFKQILAKVDNEYYRTNLSLVAGELSQGQKLESLLRLSDRQKLAFMAEIYQVPSTLLPPDLPERLLTALGNAWDAINPRELACGQIKPKLFGFPLVPTAIGGRFFADKTNYAASVTFPPSLLLTFLLDPRFFPPVDEGTLSLALRYPDPTALLLSGLKGGLSVQEVVATARTSFDYFVNNAAFTFDYNFSPMGLKVLGAAARVVIPNLTNHPALPGATWQRPEFRNPPLPSRHDLLIASVSTNTGGSQPMSYLGNAFFWKGSADDLAAIYPEGSPERTAVTGRSLSVDYFPHGGVVGAARLVLPALITDRPPFEQLDTLINGSDPFARLSAASDIIQNYLMVTREQGTLAFYLPAPNPPIFYDASGQLLGQAQLDALRANFSAQQVLDSIRSFDVNQIQVGQLYPVQEAFLRGYVDGQLLGVPVVRADVLGVPPGNGGDAYLRITAFMPTNSWLTNFVGSASLVFDVRQAPTNTIEKFFTNLLVEVEALKASGSDADRNAAAARVVHSFNQNMPKTSLEAALNNFRIPGPYADLLAIPTGSANFKLAAFSPEFEPAYAGTGPFAEARRRGGIVFKGNLRIANLVDVQNAELSVLPQGNQPPRLAGRVQVPELNLPGAIHLENFLLDFNTARAPFLSATGQVNNLQLGSVLQITPHNRPAIGVLVEQNGNPADVVLRIDPARVSLPGLQATLVVHGATPADPFVFAPQGAVNAGLTVLDGLTILDEHGSVAVQINVPNLTGSLTRAAAGAPIEMNLTLPAGLSVSVYPGKPEAQALSLNLAATLRIRDDGYFFLELENSGGQLQGVTSLPGGRFAFQRDPATGTSLRLEVNPLVLDQFRIEARNPANRLGATLLILPNNLTRLLIDPARVVSTLNYVQGSILIHGNAVADPFELNSAGGITAGITLENNLKLTDSAGQEWLNLVSPNLSGTFIRANRDARTDITLQLPSGATVQAFNGRSYAQTLSTTGQMALRFSSDRSFDLDARSAGGTINGFTLPASGDFHVLRESSGRLAIQAAVDPIPIGEFRLEGTTGPLQGALEIQPNFASSLKLWPAKLRPTDGTFFAGTLTVHGATISDPFVFSSAGTWNAGLTVSTAITVRNSGGAALLSLNTSGLSGSIARTATRTDVALSLPADLSVTVYPGPKQVIFNTAGSAALRVSSDRSFELTASLQSALAFSGLPISQVSAGGSVQLTETTLRLGFSGQALAGFAGGSATGDLFIALDGTKTLAGSVAVSPIAAGPFHLDPLSGQSQLVASLTADNQVHFTGARLRVDGVLETPVDIPAFDADLDGNFNRTVTYSGMNLAGQVGVSGSFTLRRQGGGFSIDPFSATLSVQGLLNGVDPMQLGFSGRVSTDGSLSLTNTLGSGAAFFGYTAAGMTNILERSSGDFAAAVGASQPLAHWRFNETSGSTATDQTGLADAAFVGNPQLGQVSALAGAANKSIRFDGIDDRVEVPDEAAFDLTDQITVEAWIRVDGFARNYESIVTKGDSSWRLQRDAATGRLAFDTTGLSDVSLSGNRVVDDNQWHHVVAVYDGTAKLLYVDGVLDASEPATGAIALNNAPVWIGANAQIAGRNLDGFFDDVAIYNRALSSSEVLAHYRAGGGATISTRMRFGFGSLGAVDFTGAISQNGSVRLEGSAGNVSLGGFQVTGLNAAFARTAASPASLTAAGTLQVPNVPAVSLNGTIASSGLLQLNASLGNGRIKGFEFNDLSFGLAGPIDNPAAASISATGTVAVLNLPAAELKGLVRSNGDLDLQATLPNTALAGFTFEDMLFRLRKEAGLGIDEFRLAGKVTVAGLNVSMTGTTTPEGAVSLAFNGGFNLNGFAGSGAVTLANNKLSANANFDLDVTVGGNTKDFGDIQLAGYVEKNGAYLLTGSAALNIDGYPLDPFTFKFTGSGLEPLSGSPNLNFGTQDISLSNFRLQSGGVSFSGQKHYDIGWTGFSFGIQSRLSSDVAWSMSGNSLQAQLTGTFDYSVAVLPVGPEGSYSVAGGIGSDGVFVVNNNTAAGDTFSVFAANLVDFLSSFSFDLW